MHDTAHHGLSMTEISHAIGFARISLIVGLVFLHFGTFPNSHFSPYDGLDLHGDHKFLTWLNSAIMFFFFSSVPILSMISGWLFFSFLDDNPWPSIFRRMRRRGTSLYLPLIVWNAAYLLIFYVAYRFYPNAEVFTRPNRVAMDFAHSGFMDYINAVFAVTGDPIAFQFWFVRDLFVTTLISPILWIILRHIPWIGALLLTGIWFSDWNMVIFFRTDVALFFYLGALVHHKHLTMTIPFRVTLSMLAMYVILACLRALAPYYVDFDSDPNANHFWLTEMVRFMRLPGAIGCWGIIYRAAQTEWGRKISSYGGLAFFLHSAHWPILGILKVGIWRFVPADSVFWMIVDYLTSILLTITVGISCGLFLAKKLPHIFALMNGGRGLGQTKSH